MNVETRKHKQLLYVPLIAIVLLSSLEPFQLSDIFKK